MTLLITLQPHKVSTADSALQNVVEDTTPQLGGDLASNGNDILFADNDKATFGAGSDLQIFHDGSHSYITDTGTGDLRINGASNVDIRDTTGVKMFRGVSGGETILYHNNNQKLATTATGIDVTGVVEATGYLAVEGTSGNTGTGTDRWIGGDGTAGTWFYNVPTGSNHYFAVNNTNKLAINSTGIDVTGSISADGLSLDGSYTQSKASGTFFTLTDTTNSKTGYINWESGNWNIFTNGPKKRWTIADNGDISFYEDTGTTAKFFWDASAESLGIGNTSPIAALDVTGTDAAGTLTSLGDTVTRAAAVIRGSTHANGYGLYVGYGNSTTDAQYIQSTRASGSTAFPLLLNPYGGNVGIGTSSPL